MRVFVRARRAWESERDRGHLRLVLAVSGGLCLPNDMTESVMVAPGRSSSDYTTIRQALTSL